jgi:predicted  nucleic acid-binding Zn-ribbon protein
MGNVKELELRLGLALDRIARSLAARPAPMPAQVAPAADAAELSELRAQLASERAKTAQLTERVNAVKQRQESSFTTLERRLARMTEQLDLQSLEMLRLKKANTKLIEANRQLRESHEAKVIEPSTINRAMAAELEALRAERAAERSEIEDVLGELKPLIASGNQDA